MIDHAADLDPNDAMNWLVLGHLDPISRHVMSDQGGGRWVAMDHAAKLKPHSALIQYELGSSFQATSGKDVESRQAFQRAVELNPRHFRAYLGLAYSADEKVDAAYGLGHVYWRQNQTDLALEQFQKVIRLRPAFGDAYAACGDIHAEQRLWVDARSDYEKAIGAYEAQIKNLDTSIALEEAHSHSRAAQAQKKRDERDKEKTEALLATAQHSLAQVEENFQKR